jgi:hypothetical protein
MHYDLGRQNLFMPETTGCFATMQFHTFGDIVRAAVNFRFGPIEFAADQFGKLTLRRGS